MKNKYPIASFLLFQLVLFGLGLLAAYLLAIDAGPYGGIFILYFLWGFPFFAVLIALAVVLFGKKVNRKINGIRLLYTVILWPSLYAFGAFIHFRSIDIKAQNELVEQETRNKSLLDLVENHVAYQSKTWNPAHNELEVIPVTGSPFQTHLKYTGLLVLKPTEVYTIPYGDTSAAITQAIQIAQPFLNDSVQVQLQWAVQENQFCYRAYTDMHSFSIPCSTQTEGAYIIETQVTPKENGVTIAVFIPKSARVRSAFELQEQAFFD